MTTFNRHRSEDNVTYTSGTWNTSWAVDCSVTEAPTQGHSIGTYRSMDDVVTVGFKGRSSRGEVLNHPMTSSSYTFSRTGSGFCAELSGTNCNSGSGARWKDDWSNLLNWKLGPLTPAMVADMFVPLPNDSLIEAAATQALAQVKNPSVKGLAFIAEIQQTLNLLRNPLSAATKLLSGKQGVLTKAKTSQAVSSQYLAIVFGLRPLMLDIEGLLEALLKQASERETARGSATDSLEAVGPSLPLNNGGLYATYRVREKKTASVRAGVLYAFSGRTIADSLGLSIKDLPAAMWEILPWSFVVDWFVNVGQVIDALAATCSNEFLAEWVTCEHVYDVQRYVDDAHMVNGWTVVRPCTDQDRCILKTYNRYPASLVTHVGLQLDLSFKKIPVLTSLALLMQQLTKR